MRNIAVLTFFLLSSFLIRAQTAPLLPLVRTISYKLGDTYIKIKVYQYGESKDLFFINLHDDEETAVAGAKKVLEVNGGTLIRLENLKQRNMRFKLNGNYFAFDPNRIFSRTGIIQTLRTFGPITNKAIDELGKFADRILELLPPPPTCVIALHNNFDGKFSITSYEPGEERERDAKTVYLKPKQDPDDLFLTTDSAFFSFLIKEKYNAVLQNNTTAFRDGSLSVYCGERNICYLNCETEHGKMKKYSEMITVATRFIKKQTPERKINLATNSVAVTTLYNYQFLSTIDTMSLPVSCDIYFGEKKIGTISLKADNPGTGKKIQVAKSFLLYDNMDFYYYPAAANNVAKVDMRIDPTRPKKLYEPARAVIPVKVMR